MDIRFQIPDDKIQNFSDDAKNRLHDIAKSYTLEIVSEAEKVEKIFRESGACSEVTETNIFQAIRRNKTGRKKNIRVIIVRIVAEILLFIAGIMVIPEYFITSQSTLNLGYFIAFLVVILVAIAATIVTYFIGGE